MTVVDATAIVGAVAALAGVYWTLRRVRKEQNADSNVSWQGLNNSIGKERDHWRGEAVRMTAELKDQDTAHAAEIAAIEARHAQENAEWAKKLAECQSKLEDCQRTIALLHGELYALQKLLPPNLRPGPDNAPDR